MHRHVKPDRVDLCFLPQQRRVLILGRLQAGNLAVVRWTLGKDPLTLRCSATSARTDRRDVSPFISLFPFIIQEKNVLFSLSAMFLFSVISNSLCARAVGSVSSASTAVQTVSSCAFLFFKTHQFVVLFETILCSFSRTYHRTICKADVPSIMWSLDKCCRDMSWHSTCLSGKVWGWTSRESLRFVRIWVTDMLSTSKAGI